MKPRLDTFAIVTATVDPLKAADCFRSWLGLSTYHLPVYVVWSDFGQDPPSKGKAIYAERERNQAATTLLLDAFAPGVTIDGHAGGGVVPAFALGVARAFAEGAEAVICLHDDLLIEEHGWDAHVEQALAKGVKFAGFGGATQLGSARLYHEPYDPMQLARGGFVSNMRDAEAHGRRSREAVPCVCFDGFSQIGTKDWFGAAWHWLECQGVIHHFYDGMLGCLAQRAGVQPGLMIPVACHHFGGRTAVGSPEYQRWAATQRTMTPEHTGDQGFWWDAHVRGYEAFRDILPLRVPR